MWMPVSGHEGRYEVNELGQVRSLDQVLAGRNGSTRLLPGRILKPGRASSGYLHVMLAGKDDRHIHAMVLEAFVGPRPPGLVCRHADDDKSNNKIENLSWGTKSENACDAVRNQRNNHTKKTHCKHGHPFSGENLHVEPTGHRVCRECRRRAQLKHRGKLATGERS